MIFKGREFDVVAPDNLQPGDRIGLESKIPWLANQPEAYLVEPLQWWAREGRWRMVVRIPERGWKRIFRKWRVIIVES